MEERTRPAAPSLTRAEVVVLVAVVGAMVVLRFVTRSALWLDEALSVNIARLPVSDIPDALLQDGHPPLYYVVLHVWIGWFGDGDLAVRALSGLASVATLPLAWHLGRRRSGRVGAAALLLVVAVTPFNLRYATEARMYALVMLGVFAAALLVDDLLGRFTWPRGVGLTVVTAALLWTHYWALWLGAVVGVALLVRALRSRGGRRADTVKAIGCLLGGVVLFLPWVPSLLEQADATGTPWALPASPPRVVEQLVFDVGSGDFPESLVFSLVLLIAFLVGLFATPVRASSTHLAVDLRTVPGARVEAGVAGATLALGMAVGYLTSATFASRYAAVFLPFVFVVAATGLVRMPGRTARVVLAGGLVVASLGGAYRNLTFERTQGDRLAAAIDAGAAPGDLVVFCPDQLGPAVDRKLDADVDRVVFPTFAGAERIDWVDYAERNEGADVEAFADEVDRRTGDRAVWLVWSADYRTLQQACPALLDALNERRTGGEVVANGGSAFFEHAALWVFRPR